MRIFLAVIPPSETRALAAASIEALRRPGDGVSWVREANLHYTLRFIGEVDDDGARRVAAAAREAASSHEAFGAALARHGFEPERREFNAHLTLGRTREAARDWTADLIAAAAPAGPASGFSVDAIAVVESRLSPGGAVYTVREQSRLRASS